MGCCYRPPNANYYYLDTLCDMIDTVCDHVNKIYFLGDFNIDWKSLHCPIKNKIQSITDACGLTQVITKPTRVCLKKDGSKTATCIDHIYTNQVEKCSKGLFLPIGCSDHNLVAVVRKTRSQKRDHKLLLREHIKTSMRTIL